MTLKKPLLLFLALLLPVFVFLFLKFFGENQFDVEPLFQDSVSVASECAGVYQVPYVPADSTLELFTWNKQDSLLLIVFNGGPTHDKAERTIQVTRILEEFKTEHIRVAFVTDTEFAYPDNRFQRILWSDAMVKTKSCIFLLKPEYDAVVLDTEKRIRGQYSITNRDEADRLVVEMKILLKDY